MAQNIMNSIGTSDVIKVTDVVRDIVDIFGDSDKHQDM